jgi:protein-tyrosine phosphatase
VISFAIALLASFGAKLQPLDCEPIGNHAYRITFSGPATVSVALSNGLKIANSVPSPAEVSVPSDVLHPIFRLSSGRQHRMISIRHFVLKGAPNFRDLGGYETADGHQVVWGKLYRAGSLAKLTEEDYAQLNSLGIQLVCDFRTADERKAEPTNWQGTPPTVELLPIGEEDGAMGLSAFAEILRKRVNPVEMKNELVKFYTKVPIAAANQYRQAFGRILATDAPVLWHCSAGKDRTGVFSAFLLTMLGVPRETVVADYELTNRYYFDERRLPMMAAGIRGMMHLDFDVDPEILRPALRAEPEYIQAAFGAVEANYGTFDRYRREALGISDEQVRVLRKRYLEQ